MAKKPDTIEAKKSEFLDPERLIVLMFGEDLQSGAFGKLEETLNTHCLKMVELENTIDGFQKKFDEYNSLHDKTRKLGADFKEHVSHCLTVQQAKEKAQAVADAYTKGLQVAEKKGVDDTKKTIKDTIWLIIQILTAISIATGIISFFLGLWSF